MTNNEQTVNQEQQDKIRDISSRLEAFLIENGVALQPVLISNQFGIKPYVQLVEVPKPETEEQKPEESAEIEPEIIAQA
jgi:hypothetical protein